MRHAFKYCVLISGWHVGLVVGNRSSVQQSRVLPGVARIWMDLSLANNSPVLFGSFFPVLFIPSHSPCLLICISKYLYIMYFVCVFILSVFLICLFTSVSLLFPPKPHFLSLSLTHIFYISIKTINFDTRSTNVKRIS